jgi:hypothetical protein
MSFKWTKIERGFYRLEGTLYAVQSDGYSPSKSIGADANYEGFIGGEWAAIRYRDEAEAARQDGDNLDWFPTMREARAYVERRVTREENL